jgi:predicted nucleic acid-binding protein
VAAVYFDTSALVRRYDPREPGADRVRELCGSRENNLILISSITSIEIGSALNRKVRLQTITLAERDRLWSEFRRHRRDEYHLTGMGEAALRLAEQLTFRHPLRAYDAVQVAAAMSASAALATSVSLVFITADQTQARAAESEGLQVEVIG